MISASVLECDIAPCFLTNHVRGTHVFGPIKDRKGVIKKANTQFHVDPSAEGVFDLKNDTPVSKIVITPGLDANGNPTSNASVAINTDSVSANDNYGHVMANTFNG